MSIQKDQIESIYPASSVQHALILQNFDRDSADSGFIHVECLLEGELQLETLQAAWNVVIARHESLRTSIQFAKKSKPILVVSKQADVVSSSADFRHESPEEQRKTCDIFRREDRSVGLDLTDVSVGRVTLLHLSPTSHKLFWACHHALLDGWSAAIVIEEVLAVCNSLLKGQSSDLPAPAPLKSYYQWLSSRDAAKARAHWKNVMDGCTRPTSFPIGRGVLRDSSMQWHNVQQVDGTVSADTVAGVTKIARSQQVTASTVAMSAWAVLLAAYSGDADVLFGTVLSGRSGDINGSIRMVGMFANAVPVRMAVNEDNSVGSLLLSTQRYLEAAQDYQHVALSEIQRECSSVPGRFRLFESLFLFENFANPNSGDNDEETAIYVREYHSGLTSNYPLTVSVVPGADWTITCRFDCGRFEEAFVTDLLADFINVMNGMVKSTAATLSSVMPGCDLPAPDAPAVYDNAVTLATHGATTAASTPTEEKLTQIWTDVFGLETVSVTDDFFALGGYSLLAVILVTEIEKELGVRIQASVLTEARTIQSLGRRIDDIDCSVETVDHPYVFIPAGFGEVLYHHALHRNDDGEVRVVGEMRALRLDVDYDSNTRIEDLTTRFIDEIRAIQPNGPYYLASRLCGVTVTYDVAQRLIELGETVAFLGIVDHNPPILPMLNPIAARRYRGEAMKLIRSGNVVCLAQRAFRALSYRATAIVNRRRRTQTEEELVEEATVSAFDHRDVAADYVPDVCRADVTLFLSSEYEATAHGQLTEQRWKEITGAGLNVVRLNSAEAPDIFKAPHVELLHKCLNKTRQQVRSEVSAQAANEYVSH